MAHDANGQKLHVGDVVSVQCKVTGIDEDEYFYNTAVETMEPVTEGGRRKTMILNSRQVVLRLPFGKSETDISVMESIEASKSGEIKLPK
jgi:hypothetical protein